MLPSILLLPPPPNPSSSESLKAAYGPALRSALQTVVALPESKARVLEIAVSCPQFYNKLQLPRSQLYSEATHLVASVYSLVCAICAEESIEPEGAQGVDARVILVAAAGREKYAQNQSLGSLRKTSCGPVIDLPTLAATKRAWHFIFQTDGEQGLKAYADYMELASLMTPSVKGERRLVTGGISIISTTHMPSHQNTEQVVQTHSAVAVGGTFDHLHAGHKLLLTATALILQPRVRINDPFRRLIIGITGDELLKNKKYAEYLGSWLSRQNDVVNFLFTIFAANTSPENIEHKHFDEPRVNGKAIHTVLKEEGIVIECVEIQDPFGPTITDESITALAVSGETRSGGAAVNDKRKEKDWPILEVFEVEVLDSSPNGQASSTTDSFDSKISSTAIRKRIAEEAKVTKPSL